jgi:hypothetical protein
MLHLGRAHAPNGTNMKASPRLSGEVYGMLINLSGRRRFTSQRVVLYALLASQAREGALEMSRDTLKTFHDAHVALVDGSSQVPGVFCEELRDAYFGALEGDKIIRAFIGLAQRTLEAIQSGARGAPALLDQLVESATPLLAVLNRITQVYEDLAKRQAGLAKTQLVSVMSDIELIAKQARIVAVNAQIVAARAGTAGREFSVVAGELSQITGKIDELVRVALRNSVV